MYKIRLFLMFLLAVIIMAPVQAIMLDDMDTIFDANNNGVVWADERDSTEQSRPGWMSQGTDPEDASNGVMKIDYGVSNDTAGLPDPCALYDYLGAGPGTAGDPGLAFKLGGDYLGDYDRVPAATFGPGDNMPSPIIPGVHYFTIDVYKPLTDYGEHVRALQLYDSGGARSTYHVQREGDRDWRGMAYPEKAVGRTVRETPTGWTRHIIPITAANVHEIDAADLSDIEVIKIWVSSWSAYAPVTLNPYDVNSLPAKHASWPHASQSDWATYKFSGKPILIDNLQVFTLCDRIIEGDVNHDCVVNGYDLVIVANDWLETD